MLAGALAACVPASAPSAPAAPPPAPARQPAPPAPPPPQAAVFDNWIDAPQTPGTWRYQGQSARTEAVFVGSNDAPLMRLRCVAESGRKGMVLSLPESGAARPLVTIRTQKATKTWEAQPAGRETLLALDARDPVLDAMAFARGRFAIEAAGLPPLYLPSWPEVSRVIEDCR